MLAGKLVKLALAAIIALGLLLGFSAGWSGSLAHAKGSPYTDDEARAVETPNEAEIRELRNQEIAQLRIALGRRLPENRRADLYLRLAELQLEAYRQEFLIEGRIHEKRVAAGEQGETINRKRSLPLLRSAIKANQDILATGIKYDKLDQVYYFLGYGYSELGDRVQSLRHYSTLIARYPNSQYAGAAYRELGDEAYSRRDFKKAQELYKDALKYANPDLKPRVLHKLAWSYYRTRNYNEAVDTMKQAIEKSSGSGEKFLSLREEALRDMAIFMTEGGKAEEAIKYFQKVAGDSSFYARALEKLGKQYERNVEPAKATQVYETLLKTNPDSEAAFRVRVKLIELDLRRSQFKEASKRLDALEIPSLKEDESKNSIANLKALVRRGGTENHDAFRRRANRDALANAETYYGIYLDKFLSKDDPKKETPEIKMYLAEVKRELGKSKEASKLYRDVVDSGDARYAKEASVLWTASLADTLKKHQDPAAEKEFVEASDQIQSSLGDSAEARGAAIRAAQLVAGSPSTKAEAAERARKILSKWPQHPEGITAAKLLLQLTNEGKKIEAGASPETVELVQELRSNETLMENDRKNNSAKIAAELSALETRLKVGKIAQAEKDEDYSGAGKGYEDFAASSKSRTLAEKALGNALGTYGKAGDVKSIERVTSAWLKRYPKSPAAIEAIRVASTRLLVQGKFVASAALFERLGREASDPQAHETAARLYDGSGETARAQTVWENHMAVFPRHPSRFTVALALARSKEQHRQESDAEKHYRYCMAAPDDVGIECTARLADLYLAKKDVSAAKPLYKRIAGTWSVAAKKSSPKKKASSEKATSPFVGYARYRLGELLERETEFEPLQLPEAQLKKALSQRLEFLEPLSRAYGGAVEAGGPWAIAAQHRLATWAIEFAEEVDGIQPPSGADQAAAAQFKRNLRESVYEPLRKKAISVWGEAYDAAVKNEWLSASLPEIVDRMADQHVATPLRAQGYRGKFRLAGIPADGGTGGRDAAYTKVRERLTREARDSGAWVDYGNLLWGEGKPGLARIAYERASALSSKNVGAINNLGVILVSGEGEEDWFKANEALALFKRATENDRVFLAAKMNRGTLLNYYRIFAKAKPIWEQVVAKTGVAEAHDALGISLAGLGSKAAAQSFAKATAMKLPSDRFSRVFHEAARESSSGADGASKCVDELSDSDVRPQGFEKAAWDHLKKVCEQWKIEKSG